MTMTFVYDDGGRKLAGFKGKSGDCVTRAVAIALELPYSEVYSEMAFGNATQRITSKERLAMVFKPSMKKSVGKLTAAHGINPRRQWFKNWMAYYGWTWVPTMKIGSGCKVHLRADELPSGRIICSLSRHYVAVIDGVIHDTYDPSRGGTRCVYGYWIRETQPKQEG